LGEEHRLAGAEILAAAYFKLLSSIDWEDQVVVRGLGEGLNKFLSNAHLAAFRGGNKYHKTHFISPSALQRLERAEGGGLVCEHLVPKARYIQGPCVSQARAGTLTMDFVHEQLRKFWHIATVTTDEDRKLVRVRMPDGWDGMNVLARYETEGLTLIPNPFFERLAHAEATKHDNERLALKRPLNQF